jgi:hypothetical protein
MTLKDIAVIACGLKPDTRVCDQARKSGKHNNCPGLISGKCESNNLRKGERGQSALAKANAALKN